MNLGIHQVINQSLQQRQQLVMTPAMVQAIRLLQLNSLELEQEIEQEMEENPFLEASDDEESGTEEASASLNGEEQMPTQAEREEENEKPKESEAKETDSDDDEPPVVDLVEKPDQTENNDETLDDYYDLTYDDTRYATAERGEEEHDFLQMSASGTTLYEHLRQQLHVSPLGEEDMPIAEFLIGNVDENGYLRSFSEGADSTDPLESVNGEPAVEGERDILDVAAERFARTRGDVDRILGVLQTFEPTGVFARSIQECLEIQDRAMPDPDPALLTLVGEHFDDLAHRRHKSIARAMKIPERRVAELCQRIATLEPKPGRGITSETPQYILPDVVVKKIDGRYHIWLNEGRTNHLKISSYYRQKFAQVLRIKGKGDPEDAQGANDIEFIRKKFNDAQTLIRNIERRKGTILKIAHAIMERQSEFLEKGIEHLRPMTLKDIAAEVGMHEATVSRVTSNKWVETPRGTFRLKYFFSSGLSSDDGESQSSRSIKNRIRQMIEEENSKRPLSDQKIADLLRVEGVQIARRTVTKYREQLKILPTNMRRQS